ncbi:MAG: tetratricopeptide repeat protein [Desulforhopalus sp.]|nr:tetratricopeptide repeat protein [Desulforhopalus sp.]
MIENFPVPFTDNHLQHEDFQLFSSSFAARTEEMLPTVKEVRFFNSKELPRHSPDHAGSGMLEKLYQQIMSGELFYGIADGVLLFSFHFPDAPPIIAAAYGGDSEFLRLLNESWLEEVREKLEGEFTLLREARIDQDTGLLNLANLQSVLDSWDTTPGFFLLLVELPGRRQTWRRDHQYLDHCARALRNFGPGRSTLHYIGGLTFALLLSANPAMDIPGNHDFEKKLVAWLKKEGCWRVHIGSSRKAVPNEEDHTAGRTLLNEAWTALQHAEKRGPFSFCTWLQLAWPDLHPLAPASAGVRRKISRLAAKEKQFELLLVEADDHNALSPDFKEEFAHFAAMSDDSVSVWFFFPASKNSEAMKLAKQLIKRGEEKGRTLSAGIATFPFYNFRKSEILQNCRKALIHASFFGSSSVVEFDQTSLNISGDIYFGDGDLISAVREYRHGLASPPADSEVLQEINLHNSLGVTLALMNLTASAMESFNAALGLAPDNFMALYNLGLALHDRGEDETAFLSFEKALLSSKREEGEEIDDETLQDLLFQLGNAACLCRRFADADRYLNEWLKKNTDSLKNGRVWSRLGEACHGLGEFRRARDYLQKALHFDRFDAAAMALLGDTYLQTGEGSDVALTLCRKSLEIEPQNWAHRIIYARALAAEGQFAEARSELADCMRSKRWRSAGRLEMAQLCLAAGEKHSAQRWFRRILDTEKHGTAAYAAARTGLKACH